MHILFFGNKIKTAKRARVWGRCGCVGWALEIFIETKNLAKNLSWPIREQLTIPCGLFGGFAEYQLRHRRWLQLMCHLKQLRCD